jgi:hypothetical protein
MFSIRCAKNIVDGASFIILGDVEALKHLAYLPFFIRFAVYAEMNPLGGSRNLKKG